MQALLLIDLQAAFVSGKAPVPHAEPLLASATNLLTTARQAGSLVVHVQNDGAAGAVDEPGEPVVRKSHEMCVAATARTALDRGYRVVLPHDAHATYDAAPGPGFARQVPAEVVARVAEWSLGEQIELTSSSDEVSFEHV